MLLTSKHESNFFIVFYLKLYEIKILRAAGIKFILVVF